MSHARDDLLLQRIRSDFEDVNAWEPYLAYLRAMNDDASIAFIEMCRQCDSLQEDSADWSDFVAFVRSKGQLQLAKWQQRVLTESARSFRFEIDLRHGLPHCLRLRELDSDTDKAWEGINRCLSSFTFQILDLSALELNEQEVRSCMSMPELRHVKGLALPCWGCAREEFPITAVASARLDRLELLSLSSAPERRNRIELEILMDARWFPGLFELQLHHCEVRYSQRSLNYDPEDFHLQRFVLEQSYMAKHELEFFLDEFASSPSVE